jgi:hypothetical protein
MYKGMQRTYNAARNSSKITVYYDNRSDRMDKNKILNCQKFFTVDEI